MVSVCENLGERSISIMKSFLKTLDSCREEGETIGTIEWQENGALFIASPSLSWYDECLREGGIDVMLLSSNNY